MMTEKNGKVLCHVSQLLQGIKTENQSDMNYDGSDGEDGENYGDNDPGSQVCETLVFRGNDDFFCHENVF